MLMKFRDHFSIQAREYLRYRPRYPRALVAYLASVCAECSTAWDCATGNGQAALLLTEHFELVIATDGSQAQLDHAIEHPQIDYRQALAYDSGIMSQSMDLITVAQAIHWFSLDDFFREALRVLKPEGILAFWCYSLCRVTPDIDVLMRHFYDHTVGPFWPPERAHIDEGYQEIPMPLPEIISPPFTMQAQWLLSDFGHYLRTWSAVRAYHRQHGTDPVEVLTNALLPLWGDSSKRRKVSFPLVVRVGKNTPG